MKPPVHLAIRAAVRCGILSCLVVSAMAAGPVEETFKRALFDEEGRRDYDAAMRGYQEVVRALDEQRTLAATAIFRLGECYRKLGRTNDAIAQFQRILREFPREETLVRLSRQNVRTSAALAAASAR